MKIALLTDGIYPFTVGGMQKHSYYLAKTLAAKKHFIHLYFCADKNPEKNELIKYFSEDELSFIQFHHFYFPSLIKFPGHYIRASYRYSCMLAENFYKNGNVDYIYAQGFCGWELIRQKSKGKKLPPLAVNFHGLEMFQNIPGIKSRLQSVLFRKPVKFNLMNSDIIFSLGGKLTDILRIVTENKKKISVVPIGLGDDWMNKKYSEETRNEYPKKFLFVGRYERRKRVEEINNVLRKLILSPLSDKFEFHFIGNIPDSKKIISTAVIYHGIIKDETIIRKVMHNCRVLVCPSSAEGMPTVILEAMASGMAVIATNAGAVADLVNETNGWLLSSVGELEQIIKKVIEIPSREISEKGLRGKKLIAEKFNWNTIADQILDEFRKFKRVE